MELKSVKSHMNKMFFYDIRQLNIGGSSLKDFFLTACILRKNKNGPMYYQAELTDTESKNSVIIVPLEKIMTGNEMISWKK